MALTSREILIYLYAIKKGNWGDIYKAITDKEDIPDTAECAKIIADFKKEHSGILTLTDTDFPGVLKSRKHPPFVVIFEGDKRAIEFDQIVGLETPDFSPSFTLHGIRHAYVNEEGDCVIVLPYQDKETKEWKPMITTLHESDMTHSIYTLATICKKIVAINGESEFLSNISETKAKLFAVPGNSGCTCNQLIKQGWSLCDTWKDLVFYELPKDPKPVGEEII